MPKSKDIWLPKPVEQDYRAAKLYLELLLPTPKVNAIIQALRRAPTIQREAKDILRAANLPVLQKNSPHVAEDFWKIKHGQQISPVLLVRGDALKAVPLIIADGYHRICASWLWDENCPVSCRLAKLT